MQNQENQVDKNVNEKNKIQNGAIEKHADENKKWQKTDLIAGNKTEDKDFNPKANKPVGPAPIEVTPKVQKSSD